MRVQEVYWGYVLGGATVFGTIMAVTAFVNGRATRNLLREEMRENRKLLDKMDERTAKLSKRHETMIGQHETMIEILNKMSD